MDMQVCGAAREVTGSCYLITCGEAQFLVDCGMYQGGAEERDDNFDPFVFDPDQIDFVLLTHAHIDHCGLIPRLVQEGFQGTIYATHATADLSEIMLLDSAHIQEMEAEWQSRKSKRAGRRAKDPLYTTADAEQSLRLFQGVNYGEEFSPAPGVRARYRDAGHILGSAFIELWMEEQGEEVTIVFSGDVGQPGQPIIRDPETATDTDYLVMESTYGDRLHDQEGEPVESLVHVLQEAQRAGGNVIIPSFALGRTQELIYFLRERYQDYGLDMPIYIDSPLAKRATEIYRRHRGAYDSEAIDCLAESGSIFTFPEMRYTESADESRELNGKNGIVIISASGMADAGRVKHHLKHNLWRPENHVVIVGFQAQGTLGRRLLDGEKRVKIFGEDIAVKAKVHFMPGLSAHADRNQLLEWASHVHSPRRVFLTHGEAGAIFSLKELLEDRLGFSVAVPRKHQIYRLEGKTP